MSNFTFRLYLDKRYQNNNPENYGKFQVKVRATSIHTKKTKLLPTDIYIKSSIFNALYPAYVSKKVRAKKSFQDTIGIVLKNKENQELKEIIDLTLKEWRDADTPETRTIKQLIENKGFKPESADFSAWVENYCKANISESNKARIKASFKKILTFFKSLNGQSSQLSLYDITADLLEKWEDWMINEKGHKYGTQIDYATDIRKVLNLAIKSPSCSYNKNSYPFYLKIENEKGYVIKEDNQRPITNYIDDDDLKKFLNYKPKTDLEQIAHDLWMFSYDSAGMNATDIFNMKWNQLNLEEEVFLYYRKKTSRQRRQVAKSVSIHQGHLDIIERNKGKGEYVFDFHKKYKSVHNLTDQVGRQLKKIGENLEIKSTLNFMSARNSSFTNLSKSNSAEEILETLNTHTKISTLKGYLKKLNQKEKRDEMYKGIHKR